MVKSLIKKSISLILRRQTNILSAAFVIMGTIILSQILGIVRTRLLIGIFGASNTLGVYFASSKLPDFLFQLVIASALSSAFIPVFADYLNKNEEQEAHTMASTLLTIGLGIFTCLSIILAVFAPFFVQFLNLGSNFSPEQIVLMVNLMRIIIVGQLLFIIATFLTAILQSYNQFLIPGFAAALYNLGIIIGILTLSSFIGIYAAAVGTVIGAFIFILFQLPMIRKIGFRFTPSISFRHIGVKKVAQLMWPRTISSAVFQLGSLTIIALVSFLPDPGRNYVILDLAQTLAFAPVALIGQAISQAAFPVLSREKDRLDEFRLTFINSFNQMLYLILPISVLLLILRIPVVRLIYGAPKLDWPATVLTGKTLAFFAISIFAQALIILVYKAFYALHNTKIPLIVGSIATAIMIVIAYIFIIVFKFGIESLAVAFTIAGITQLSILLILLGRRIGGFDYGAEILSLSKLFFCTLFTGFALYIPIKLLDQLVFDTTRTINLLMLTGISSAIGLSLYLFLTWLFNIKEASTYILALKKIGSWREAKRDILGNSDEVIGETKF